jgi:hypothetical protein
MVISPVIVKSEISGRYLLVELDMILKFNPGSFFLFNSLALGPIGTTMAMTSRFIANTRIKLYLVLIGYLFLSVNANETRNVSVSRALFDGDLLGILLLINLMPLISLNIKYFDAPLPIETLFRKKLSLSGSLIIGNLY